MRGLLVLIAGLPAVWTGIEEDAWLQRNRLSKNLDIEAKDTPRAQTKIIGGRTVNIASYPYQLSLRYEGYHICGASIISPTWAMTAGHCVSPKPPLSSVRIHSPNDKVIYLHLFRWQISLRAGSSNRVTGGLVYTVSQIEVHPNFNGLNFDVAVLRTTAPFLGPNIKAIPLAVENTAYSAGSSAIVSGWGYTSPRVLPEVLQAVSIPIVAQSRCADFWGRSRITGNMICAGQMGLDSCNGDSGGPLVLDGRQIGIVSWGSSNCGGPLPGVFTRVASPSVRGFIRRHTGV
jgi:hypothetical protein